MSPTNERHELTFFLTTVYLEDAETGRITAFFAQFPEASSEGRNKEEAKKLLDEIFPVMLEDKKDDFISQLYKNDPSKVTVEQQRITA